jgi:acetyl-CoA C-acetyltransferase
MFQRRHVLTIKNKAYIAGIYEHPTRHAPDKSTAQLHAEVAKGALDDAGLTKADVDGYFCAGDAPGFGALSMVDYMGLTNLRHLDSTETGGSSYILAWGTHAAGDCRGQVFGGADHARGPAAHRKRSAPPRRAYGPEAGFRKLGYGPIDP